MNRGCWVRHVWEIHIEAERKQPLLTSNGRCNVVLSHFAPDKSKLPWAQGMLFAALSRTHSSCCMCAFTLTAMETGFYTQIRVLSRVVSLCTLRGWWSCLWQAGGCNKSLQPTAEDLCLETKPLQHPFSQMGGSVPCWPPPSLRIWSVDNVCIADCLTDIASTKTRLSFSNWQHFHGSMWHLIRLQSAWVHSHRKYIIAKWLSFFQNLNKQPHSSINASAVHLLTDCHLQGALYVILNEYFMACCRLQEKGKQLNI